MKENEITQFKKFTLTKQTLSLKIIDCRQK